jgi:signal transduction histidine kinase
MIDAMLTIQRLDAGTTFLKVNITDIRDILHKVVADYEPMAELEGHELILDLPDDPLLLEVDAEKIGLVFSNLISNAIKFTPEEGQVEVAVQDQAQSILVIVKDNGVGLSPEDQKQIFERFYQVRPENMVRYGNLGVGAGHGGMGIGLTIVKHLVDLHHGKVWVESEVGQGSTFFVQLPKTTVASQVETPFITTKVKTY